MQIKNKLIITDIEVEVCEVEKLNSHHNLRVLIYENDSNYIEKYRYGFKDEIFDFEFKFNPYLDIKTDNIYEW